MKMLALLRGINVGGNRKIPMSELCDLALRAGLTEVKHYINSGNIVFDAGKLKADQVATLLENAIEKRFGFQVDVIVRTANQWKKYAKGSSTKCCMNRIFQKAVKHENRTPDRFV